MADADIGLVGLGTMGANLALNMADNGFKVAVYNRTTERMTDFVDRTGRLRDRFIGCETLDDLAAAIRPPRPVVIMVQAGGAVDATMETLFGPLDEGDILIDAGNSNFHHTRDRAEKAKDAGKLFLGLGVSGGEEGARYGPALMAGGDRAAYDRVEHILTTIAADFEGEPCSAWLGPDGAGHFVKMVHNGIEYADMQMIAEVYGVMRDGLGMSPDEMAAVFARWNDGPLKSYLIEITGKVLAASDPDTGKPMIDVILDAAGQKGTGRWTAIEAQMLAAPATAIEAAVAARSLSSRKAERKQWAEQFDFAPRAVGDMLGDRAAAMARLESALLAGKVAAYAQGFALLSVGSAEWDWNLPLTTVARIWRAGCIIRSALLDTIASGYEAEGEAVALFAMPDFADMIRHADADLRAAVSACVASGIAVPALSAALAYLDGVRTARSTANLIQGQRDFFGAHGFERTDREGKDFHGPWAMGFKTD